MRFLPLLAIGKDWWLPTNYAVHGRETDALFQWFFWITTFVFFAVELLLVFFLFKYRRRKSHTRARHWSGSGKLEFFWTLIPTLILGGLAYGSERVWHDYRSSSDLENPQRSKILIIGQQFKWNVIYPGPDGKFGRYLVFPRPTDLAWPVGPDGQPNDFKKVPGPASLPYGEAVRAINDYVQENPLGKDYSDPDGKDDDCGYNPGRRIYVPVNRPVEVQLQSMDVIHDFFIPNFRAQLYAVPGMTGRFVFTPTVTTAEIEAPSRETISVDELIRRVHDPAYAPLTIDIDAECAGALHDKTGWRYPEIPRNKRSPSIVRDGMEMASEVPDPAHPEPPKPVTAEKLKASGVAFVNVHKAAPFEIACAQLCGNQHYMMRGEMVVLSQEEFDKKFPAYPHAPVP